MTHTTASHTSLGPDMHPDPVVLAVIADDRDASFDNSFIDELDTDDPCTPEALREARAHLLGCAVCAAQVAKFLTNRHTLIEQTNALVDDPGTKEAGTQLVQRVLALTFDDAFSLDEGSSSPGLEAVLSSGEPAGPTTTTLGAPTEIAAATTRARRLRQQSWFAAAALVIVAALGIGGLISSVKGSGDDSFDAAAPSRGRVAATNVVETVDSSPRLPSPVDATNGPVPDAAEAIPKTTSVPELEQAAVETAAGEIVEGDLADAGARGSGVAANSDSAPTLETLAEPSAAAPPTPSPGSSPSAAAAAPDLGDLSQVVVAAGESASDRGDAAPSIPDEASDTAKSTEPPTGFEAPGADASTSQEVPDEPNSGLASLVPASGLAPETTPRPANPRQAPITIQSAHTQLGRRVTLIRNTSVDTAVSELTSVLRGDPVGVASDSSHSAGVAAAAALADEISSQALSQCAALLETQAQQAISTNATVLIDGQLIVLVAGGQLGSGVIVVAEPFRDTCLILSRRSW